LIPDWLKPATENPARPKDAAFLYFVYGWVEFNVKCGNKALPVAADLPPASHSILDYIAMQYNYEDYPAAPERWFSAYTRLVHASEADGGLDAAAYAFSIDDQASFLSNDGLEVPGGLILAVGGPKGLVNGVRHAPPVPLVHRWYQFSVGLGT